MTAMTAMSATTLGHVERVIYSVETVAAASANPPEQRYARYAHNANNLGSLVLWPSLVPGTLARRLFNNEPQVTGTRGARWVLAEVPFAQPIGVPLAQARHR
ncbi:hypothetical protein I7I51_06788 [Histoplasma capsulatum]|uniref:Uncharacterized protein n=1 Tax=Ajellomyces capsulatus TaxID=5037 RepID=A0A8A1MPE0_AJECA|nr:hypothetical protein I7I51_06788 [Histoplasma capsulatum]